MVVTAVVYGIAALAVLVSGNPAGAGITARAAAFIRNPCSGGRLGVLPACRRALSLYPTITYILWRFRLRKG